MTEDYLVEWLNCYDFEFFLDGPTLASFVLAWIFFKINIDTVTI